MWNTIKPRRLETVVSLLSQEKATIDGFYHAYIFKPYKIDIENVLANQDLEGAKRLLDFSFMTRQGGQVKEAIDNYEGETGPILTKLKAAMGALTNEDWEPEQRYETALALINSISDIGQKIATMFLKFLVYYGRGFPNKKDLEREIFIPFDIHTCNLLFSTFNGGKPNRLNLYDEAVQQTALNYKVTQSDPVMFANTKLIKLQRKIRDDFDELGIDEPPIVLDYLWYVGMMYCSNRLASIGCTKCFLKNECETGRAI